MTNPDIEKKVNEFVARFFVYDMGKNRPHGDHVGADKTAAEWLCQAFQEIRERRVAIASEDAHLEGYKAGKEAAEFDNERLQSMTHYQQGAADMEKRIWKALKEHWDDFIGEEPDAGEFANGFEAGFKRAQHIIKSIKEI